MSSRRQRAQAGESGAPCPLRAQASVELLIMSFFAVAIILALFSVYTNMLNVNSGDSQLRHAQAVAGRLAGAMNAVGQGIDGSEARVSLADASGLEVSFQGRSVRAAWSNYGGGRSEASSPTFTDNVDFSVGPGGAGGKNLIVKKDGEKIVVRQA
ncbi:Uncharacterised protein [Candidatus Burarchaeum australiense]|nr:Uncharacterised protein [Candidatus Burarchaeum australiense]